MTAAIFVLLEDSDGTMFSSPKPTGDAVTTEEAAKQWVAKETVGYSRGYRRVRIVEEPE